MIDFKNFKVSIDLHKPIEEPKYPEFHINDASTWNIYESEMQHYQQQLLALNGREQEVTPMITLTYKF